MNMPLYRSAAIIAGFHVLFAVSAAWADASTSKPAQESPTASQPAQESYLSLVQSFADSVLRHGRDVYGEKHTPLLVDGINIDTYEPAVWLLPEDKAVEWKLPRRWVLSNFASQQNLFRVLTILTELTGNQAYEKVAIDATRYMFDHYQNENGLLYWGGHSAIDLVTKQPVGEGRYDEIPGKHELKSCYPFYALLWKVDPQATHRFIDAFWSAHILNWDNLDMNRHGYYRPLAENPWSHTYSGGGPVPFVGDGLSFFHTGSDLFYASSMLYSLSRYNTALRWGKYLAQRYADACDPNTHLGADNYSIERTNRMKQQFGAEFGDRFTEATVTSLYRNRYQRAAICQLKLYEKLGPKAEDFYNFALQDLKAYALHAYDPNDSSFWATLIDGTKLSPEDIKREGYVQTRWLEKRPADPLNLWAYTLAWKLSKRDLMWQMSRDIAKGLSLGNISSPDGKDRSLNMQSEHADPITVFAFLELYDRSRDMAFLAMARHICDNLIAKEFHKGFFVADKDHVFCTFDTVTPLALLYVHIYENHLSRRLLDYCGGKSYFHCTYEGLGRTYDRGAIYGQVRHNPVSNTKQLESK